jgi:hypothetical protein
MLIPANPSGESRIKRNIIGRPIKGGFIIGQG